MKSWLKKYNLVKVIPSLEVNEFESLMKTGRYILLDVRNKREVEKEKVAGSVHIPLNELKSLIIKLDKEEKWLVHCAGGYRSMIACSILKVYGIEDVSSVKGGINSVKNVIPELIVSDLEIKI